MCESEYMRFWREKASERGWAWGVGRGGAGCGLRKERMAGTLGEGDDELARVATSAGTHGPGDSREAREKERASGSLRPRVP